MKLKQTGVCISVAWFTGAAMLLSQVGFAQDAKVKTAMELLGSKANKLGPPKIDGTDTVAGKQVPAIYFGSTKIAVAESPQFCVTPIGLETLR